MQCLTLKEKFIFTCPIKYRLDEKNSDLSDTYDSILLITIKAIYIFEPTIKKNDQNKQDDFLENKLIFKCEHRKVYIEKFTNETNEVKYVPTPSNEVSDSNDNKNNNKNKKNDIIYSFVIKLETPLAKEYIKILALFEGLL